jgi:hypothetical protein
MSIRFHMSVLFCLTFAAFAHAAPTETRDPGKAMVELEPGWAGLPYLGDPGEVGSLPRYGGPGDPEHSAAARLPLELEKRGRCATTSFAPNDAVKMTFEGAEGLLATEVSLYDAKGYAMTSVYETSGKDDAQAWLLVAAPGGDLTACIPDGAERGDARLLTDSVLPDVMLVATATASALPGEPIRVEAALVGRGSRANPKDPQLTVHSSDGQVATLSDTGKGGDAVAGDGVYSALLTATGKQGSALDLEVHGSATAQHGVVHRSADLRSQVGLYGGRIDHAAVGVTAEYVRVPLIDVEVGSAVRASYGIGDDVLTTVSVLATVEGDDLVAYVPRWKSSSGADTVALQLLPYRASETGDTAVFKLP